MENRKYYEAYDDRYRQIHSQNLTWFDEKPSAIVYDTIQNFSLSKQCSMLEIGCGEGRDAFFLLKDGFSLLATDISREAISYCRKKFPEYQNSFQVMDCLTAHLEKRFNFIFAVAVLHMLVLDSDRAAFYDFIRRHLELNGIALICTMGNGVDERQSNIHTAFDMQERIHEPSGKHVQIVSTSCRIVNFDTFSHELKQNCFSVLNQGITSIEPDFSQMMFAVVTAR